MKKMMIIILSVMVLILAGCSSKNAENVATQKESVTEIQASTEEPTEKPTVEEKKETEQLTETEPPKQEEKTTVADNSNTESTKIKTDSTQSDNKSNEAEQPKDEPKEEPKVEQQAPVQPAKADYSPANVVSLATAKTKAAGKILLTDNLDSLLANGSISQEEYNSYYPYDGAGYYSVYVQTDLNTASTTSGRLLGSEDGIAQYIAEMLACESGPYFLIEYVGVYTNGSGDFYEFRCYRA